jgi:hypothetical protein
MKFLKLFLVLFIIEVTTTNIYAQEINPERYKNRENPVFELYKQNNVSFIKNKGTTDEYFTFLGQWDMPNSNYSISNLAYKDNHVFGYAYYNEGFYSINVENPEEPITANLLEIGTTYAGSTQIKGNFAYVTGLCATISVVDISDPANMTIFNEYTIPNTGGPDEIFSSCISGDYLFLMNWDGFFIYEIHGNGELEFIIYVDLLSSTMEVAMDFTVQDNYLYLTSKESSTGYLRCINISDINNPLVVSNYTYPDKSFSITVKGDYAYVAGDGGYITVIDIVDPVNPELIFIKMIEEGIDIYSLNIINQTLFAANGRCFAYEMDDFRLITAGEYVGNQFYAGHIVGGEGNTLYISEGNKGIAVVEYDFTVSVPDYKNINFYCYNFPNPFTEHTTITFENPNNGKVNLSIFNSIGQEVFTVIDKVLPAGIYNKEINTNRLKSGVYFYNLTTTEGIISEKMIKVN